MSVLGALTHLPTRAGPSNSMTVVKVPYFLISHHIAQFEDGWAAFCVAATCRLAWESSQPTLQQLRRAKQDLLDMMEFLQQTELLFPGFDTIDALAVHVIRLRLWDPPLHTSITANPPAWMLDTFHHAAEMNMEVWIRGRRGCRGHTPLALLERLNPTHQNSPHFQKLLAILREGEARFLFSPVVEDVVEDPEVESLLPLSGPGLLIAVRYRGFGLAICLRYNTLHYMDGLVLPWVAYYVNTHGPPF